MGDQPPVDAFRAAMFARFPGLEREAGAAGATGLLMIEVEVLRRRVEEAQAAGRLDEVERICVFVEEVLADEETGREVVNAIEISFIEDLLRGDPNVWTAIQGKLGPMTAERVWKVKAAAGLQFDTRAAVWVWRYIAVVLVAGFALLAYLGYSTVAIVGAAGVLAVLFVTLFNQRQGA